MRPRLRLRGEHLSLQLGPARARMPRAEELRAALEAAAPAMHALASHGWGRCIWFPGSRPPRGLGHATPIPSGPRRRRHHPRVLGAGRQPCRWGGGGHGPLSQARWRQRECFDRAAVLLCWGGRAAHPAAEIEAEAELELVRRSGEVVWRSGLGRQRRGEGEATVRAVPGLHGDTRLQSGSRRVAASEEGEEGEGGGSVHPLPGEAKVGPLHHR